MFKVHHVPGTLGRSGLLSDLGGGLGGLSSRSGGSSVSGSLSLLLGRLRSSLGGGRSLSRGGSGLGGGLGNGLLLLVLRLLLLCLVLLLAEQGTEDRGTLPASRPLALVGLDVLGLLLGRSVDNSSGLSGSRGGGLGSRSGLLSRSGGLLRLLLLRLLLLLNRLRLEGSNGGLVLLRLGDSLGELLGLGDLGLDLVDPVVALGSRGSLEGVLVTLGGQDKLVGAVGGGLSSFGLEETGEQRQRIGHVKKHAPMHTSKGTYQGNGAGGGGLVSALLVEEQETLAGLAGPGGEVVVLQQSRGLLDVNGLRTEPEELLGVDEVPVRRTS